MNWKIRSDSALDYIDKAEFFDDHGNSCVFSDTAEIIAGIAEREMREKAIKWFTEWITYYNNNGGFDSGHSQKDLNYHINKLKESL